MIEEAGGIQDLIQGSQRQIPCSQPLHRVGSLGKKHWCGIQAEQVTPSAIGTWGRSKLCVPPEEVALKRMGREKNSRWKKQQEQRYKSKNPRKCLSRNS